MRDQNWTTDSDSRLIKDHDLARRAGLVAEIVVGIKPGIAVIPVTTAVVFIAAPSGAELDLSSAFTGTLCAGYCRRQRNFFNCVDAGPHEGKETVA